MKNLNYGDWGLGIGDWGLAQSPIPNPQEFRLTFIINKKFYLSFNLK